MKCETLTMNEITDITLTQNGKIEIKDLTSKGNKIKITNGQSKVTGLITLEQSPTSFNLTNGIMSITTCLFDSKNIVIESGELHCEESLEMKNNAQIEMKEGVKLNVNKLIGNGQSGKIINGTTTIKEFEFTNNTGTSYTLTNNTVTISTCNFNGKEISFVNGNIKCLEMIVTENNKITLSETQFIVSQMNYTQGEIIVTNGDMTVERITFITSTSFNMKFSEEKKLIIPTCSFNGIAVTVTSGIL